MRVRILPAQLDGDAAPSTDLTGINSIVVEVLAGHVAVLVTDQTIIGDYIRVEIQLDCGVVCNDLWGGG